MELKKLTKVIIWIAIIVILIITNPGKRLETGNTTSTTNLVIITFYYDGRQNCYGCWNEQRIGILSNSFKINSSEWHSDKSTSKRLNELTD